MIKWKFYTVLLFLPENGDSFSHKDPPAKPPGKGAERGIALNLPDCLAGAAHHGPGVISRSKKCLSQNDPQLAWGCISGLQQERSMYSIASCSTQSTTLPSLSGRQVGLGVWGRRILCRSNLGTVVYGVCSAWCGLRNVDHLESLSIANVWSQFNFVHWHVGNRRGKNWVRGEEHQYEMPTGGIAGMVLSWVLHFVYLFFFKVFLLKL